MISKIIWELREDKSIKKVTKLTNRLYANSKASAEYNVISDAILPTDTLQMILSIGDKEYHKLLHYGDILLEDGTKAKGWSIISNGEELALEIENNGYEKMFVSFEIKRFSSLDASVVLKSFTTAQDEVLIYSSDSYTPMVEATDAEILENEISRINATLSDVNDLLDTKVDKETILTEPASGEAYYEYTNSITSNLSGIGVKVNKTYQLGTGSVGNRSTNSVNIEPGSIDITAYKATSGMYGDVLRTDVTVLPGVRPKLSVKDKVNDITIEGDLATTNDIAEKSTADRLYVDEKIESVKKAMGYVFDTYNNFFNWIEGNYTREDVVTVNDLNVGDDIFIVEEGVPDYWVKSKSSPMTITDFAPYESGDYKPTITWLEG